MSIRLGIGLVLFTLALLALASRMFPDPRITDNAARSCERAGMVWDGDKCTNADHTLSIDVSHPEEG